MTTLKDKLALVRRYTGDRFSAARGYDARRPMSKARGRTINRYYEAILELTSIPHKVWTPKKGMKREAFEYTGQKHLPRFTKAFIPTPDANGRYSFTLDKTRPKGSRFTVINRRTRERSWHIPAEVFLEENELLYDEDAEIPPEFFQAIIEYYAVRGQVYMIEAGDFHMWGDAGPPALVAEKLSLLFKQYGSGNFDPYDKNSHHIRNWFRGIKVFGQDEMSEYGTERALHSRRRQTEWNLAPQEHWRMLRSGDLGHFVKGKLADRIPRSMIPGLGQKVISTPEYGLVTVHDPSILKKARARRDTS